MKRQIYRKFKYAYKYLDYAVLDVPGRIYDYEQDFKDAERYDIFIKQYKIGYIIIGRPREDMYDDSDKLVILELGGKYIDIYTDFTKIFDSIRDFFLFNEDKNLFDSSEQLFKYVINLIERKRPK